MPTFDAKGLEGDEFLEEEGQGSTTAEDDGAGEDEESGRESQAGASHEVIPILDSGNEENERAPHTEAPFVVVPPEDIDVEDDEVPLAARLRKRMVFSDEDLGRSDLGARGEEVSSSRARAEEAPADGSR